MSPELRAQLRAAGRAAAGTLPEDWNLWAVNRGLFDTMQQRYYEEHRPEWVRQRRAWAAEHGWPGGEAMMLAEEVVIEDEPFDPSEI